MSQVKAALYPSACVGRMRTICLSLVALTLAVCAVPPANAASGQLVAHNTPTFVSTAKNLGAEDPAKSIEVSIWLNLHNRTALDSLAQQLYDPTSSNYHHWLKNSDLARFAPTAEEASTVREFLESHNLKVVNVGPNNFFVRARGTVGDVETAFHVTLNNYQVRDQVIRSNDRDPYVEGGAAPLVRSVSGLDTGKYEHPMMSRTTTLPALKTAGGSGALAGPKPAAIPPDDFYSSNCFKGVEKESFSTSPGGPLPMGTYSGNHLNLESLTSMGCGYTPPAIQTAYHLTGLYAEGYAGAGQTIAIIDWCGSPTIKKDANTFSARFGLPPLTASNFNIFNIPAPSHCAGPDPEINLDVEWAHAVAPAASINLIVPPSAYFQDIDEAEYLTIYNGLGSVISGSYGSPEIFLPTTELETGNLLSELAAVYGISANFSTGDDGDFSAIFDAFTTVSYPADTPCSTAVGGVSLALNSDNSIAWQAGWGNNQTLLANQGIVFDPVYIGDYGFVGGSGGGPANCLTKDLTVYPPNCLTGFPKPAFQHKLPGKDRLLPDVSWLADPYTGVVILISVPGQSPAQTWTTVGGTSVACPMFSALWAIANEESEANGGSALGQAASHLYSLPAGAIYDVVPVGSKTNVTASIVDLSPTTGLPVTTAYTAAEVLGGPTPNPPAKFVSAIWDNSYYQDTALVLSFGTDCAIASPSFFFDGTTCNAPTALHTKVGWDNVTGVGTPNAQAFADAFNPTASAAAK
jgi:subtilase family serine protease